MIYKNISVVIIFALNSISLCGQNSHSDMSTSLRGNGMGFTENKGQIVDMENNPRPDILLKGGGAGTNVFIRKTGISYVVDNYGQVAEEVKVSMEEVVRKKMSGTEKKELLKDRLLKIHRIDMDFDGADPNSTIEYADKVEGYSNYYYAHCAEGITNVNSWNRILQKNIYNNIDVVYYGDKQSGLKYDIIVNPGGNPDQIQLKYSGTDELNITHTGELQITNLLGVITEFLPKVYQRIDGKVVDVKAAYLLKGQTVSFRLGVYNKRLPLIIDPWITYIGGGYSSGVAVDQFNGDVVTSGLAGSANFPVTPGAFQTVNRGGTTSFIINGDIFVCKFNEQGSLLWCTYYGGTNTEYSLDVAVDNAGNTAVSGYTNSSNFPVSTGAFQTARAGDWDAVVIKFDPSGIRLWGTYYGGSKNDHGLDITTDNNNDVIITGCTASSNFPITVGAFQTALPPFTGFFSGVVTALVTYVWPDLMVWNWPNTPSSTNINAFVVKFNSLGARQWATYCGGSSGDIAYGIAADSNGDIVITGGTASSNFPVTPGAIQTAFSGIPSGTSNIFVAKFNSSGIQQWATYYGGIWDIGKDIAIDKSNGDIVLAGLAGPGFPITAGAFQTAKTSTTNFDDYLLKLNSSGSLLWATYFGTTCPVLDASCSIDANSNIYLWTEFEDTAVVVNVPVSLCAFQKTNGGVEDQFIAKFNGSGNFLCGTYLGGNMEDDLDCGKGGIACYQGYIYVSSNSAGGYPVTPGAFRQTHPSPLNVYDVTLAKICGLGCGEPYTTTGSFLANTVSACPNIPINFSISSSTGISCDTSATTYVWSFTGATTLTSTLKNPANITWNTSGTYNVSVKVQTPCDTLTLNQPNYITINPCGLTAQAIGQSVCSGACATISAIGANGISPYTYNWNNGSSGQIISVCPTSNTTYTVTVTDNAGATTTSTTTVVVNSLLSVVSSQTPVSCNSGNDGMAMATPSGGNSPYTYSWSNNLTTQQLNNLTIGNYSVAITDALGCITNTVIIITEPAALSVTTNTSTANCNQGVGSASVSVGGGIGPYSYSWSNNSTTQQISNLSSGNYSVTITDNNGCTQQSSITVGNFPGVTAQLNSTSATSCFGSCNGIATISGSGGGIPYTYNWSNGQTTDTPTNLCAGTYTVTITDAGGCFSTINVNITQPSGFQLLTSGFSVSCNGDSTGSAGVNVNGGTAPYSYAWSNNSSTQQLNNLSAGTYSITITDALGCITNTAITITEPPAISYGITTTDETCGQNNGTAAMNLSGGVGPYNYLWSTNSVAQQISNLVSGNYTVKAYDNNGCTVQSTATINNTGNPANILLQPNLCLGSTYNLPDGSTTSTSGIYTHTLNTTAGCDSVITTQLSIGSPINITQSPNICSGSTFTLPLGTILSTGGTYKDTLTAIGGCDSIITTNLTVHSSVSISQSPSICSGTSYTLPNGSIVNTSGIYTHSFTTSNGCDSIITTQLTVNNIAAGNQILAAACDSIQYNNQWYYTTQTISDTLPNSSSIGCDSITITQLTITKSTNNLISPIACNNYTNNSQTYTTSGIYTQTLNTINGCDSILTINLTIASSISTADSINICDGQSTTIHGISYDTIGIYNQTFTATGGCDSTSSVSLFVDARPTVNVGNDTTIIAGQTIVISAAGGSGIYSWSTGQTTATINQQPTITTTYILTITDNNGCVSADTVIVFVDNLCDDNTEVFVPNSFSPNEDGQNDVLQLYTTNNSSPFGGGREGAYFAIYNRWGERVFETEDLNKSWDGIYRNKPCDTAVFTWVLKITCKGNATEMIRTGNISLMK